jgi:uncharacterized protein (TIGR01777 family)
MSAEARSVVAAPLHQVFAWHERPGALTRLLPPWQPVRVHSESANLRDGRAELAIPGGVRWVAQHRDLAAPHRFVDELVSLPLRWRHEHTFAAVDDGHTEVRDHIDTPVPSRLLAPMLAFRHRQLHCDLAAHADWPARRLTVAVSGASGLIGTALCAFLSTGGHEVIRLERSTRPGPTGRHWDPEAPAADLLDGVDAVIHLAGASVAGRFTAEHKHAVRESRVEPTRRLADVAARTPRGPRVFVAASAIGYYGPRRGDELLDERAPRGDGFLADVVADWERATAPAAEAGLRVAHVRTGIVQSPLGGALRTQRPLFTVGLGGTVGDPAAWLSWIGLDDLLDVYLRALHDETVHGPVNAVAPHPVRAEEYARTLARVMRRPALLPVPALGPRLLLGDEGAREIALASQHVVPARLAAADHRFRHPRLAAALAHQLGRAGLPGTAEEPS